MVVGFHSLKQKFAFQICIDFHQGLRAATNVNGGAITFKHGPSVNRNLVTEDTINQLVSHTLASHGDSWTFLKAFVRTVDTYITELENLVVD